MKIGVLNANGTEIVKGGTIYGAVNAMNPAETNGKLGNGGAFYVAPNTEINVLAGNIVGNEAYYGGAFLNEGVLSLGKDVKVLGNLAQIGGAVFNNDETAFVNSGLIAQNYAKELAGGIFAKFMINLTGTSAVHENKVLVTKPFHRKQVQLR